MKAVLINEKTRELYLSDVEKPTPKDGEILIEVYAAALNRADLLQRAGKYPSPVGWPQWMGLEVSGIVAGMGKTAAIESGFSIGDPVCALLGGGGYAEYVCAPYGMVMPKPKKLDFIEASTLPEAYATSYLNLFIEGHLKKGQTLFIPAGAGGLSSVAIPMAKAFGCYVITSVLTDAIKDKIAPLGADVVIVSDREDTSEILKREAENGHPVNVAMDCLSGDMLGKCLPYMAEGGYWVIISTLAGTETTIPLRAVLTKGLHIVGSMLRKRSPEEKAEILSELVEKVWEKIESGEMKPTVYRSLPLEEAARAHAILERGENVGKVVLTVKTQ